MPLQQMNFQTSIFTGTQRQAGTGESLANLVLGGVKAANAISKQQKSFDEEDRIARERKDRDYQKKSTLHKADIAIKKQGAINTFNENNPDPTADGYSEALEIFYSDFDEEIADIKSQLSVKDKKDYDLTRLKEDGVVQRGYASEGKRAAQQFSQASMQAMVAQGLVTLEGIKEVNDISTQDKLNLAIKSADTIIFNEIKQNPEKYKNYTKEMFMEKFPALSEVKNKELIKQSMTKVVGIVEKRQGEANKGTVEAMSLEVLNGAKTADIIAQIRASGADSKTKLALITKLETLNTSKNKIAKKDLDNGIKLYNTGTDISSEDTVDVIQSKANNILSKNGIKSYATLTENIRSTYIDEPKVMTQKLIELEDKFKKNRETAQQIKGHTYGASIPEAYSASSKKVIKANANKMFSTAFTKLDYTGAGTAVKTLGGLPKTFSYNITNAIENGDKQSLQASLGFIYNLKGVDKAAFKLAAKDPMMASLYNYAEHFIQPDGTINTDRVQSVLENQDMIESHRKDILKSLKSYQLKDYPYHVQERVAQEMAYDKAFKLEGKGDLKSQFKDKVEDSLITVGKNKILDTKGFYTEEGTSDFLELLKFRHQLPEDSQLTAIVAPNGTLEVYTDNGIPLSAIDNPKHQAKMIAQLSIYKKDRKLQEVLAEKFQAEKDRLKEDAAYKAQHHNIPTPIDGAMEYIGNKMDEIKPDNMGWGEWFNRKLGDAIGAGGK